jgi:hypothetical protein
VITDPTSELTPAEKAEAAEAAQRAFLRQWFDLAEADPDPISVPIPDQHEPDTCTPRCEACTALLLALSHAGVVVVQPSDEGPLEVCGGEWLPMNASSQACSRCSEQRAIPEDCVGEHADCGPAHRYHLEPYVGAEPRYEVREPLPLDLWREPTPSDVSSMGEGPEVAASVALPESRLAGECDHEDAEFCAAAGVHLDETWRERWEDQQIRGIWPVRDAECVECHVIGWQAKGHHPMCSTGNAMRPYEPQLLSEGTHNAEREARITREYGDVIDYGSARDSHGLRAAEELLDAWIAMREAYENARDHLPPNNRARFEAYTDQLFERSSRMLGMQSVDEWMRELAQALVGEFEEAE